jgi:hypothetical protein
MTKRISRKQFELAVKAISSGVYYSAHPESKEKMQEVAIEDIGLLPDQTTKDQYIAMREFGKDLFFTHPKGTSPDDIIAEYIDSIFDYIKVNEDAGI